MLHHSFTTWPGQSHKHKNKLSRRNMADMRKGILGSLCCSESLATYPYSWQPYLQAPAFMTWDPKTWNRLGGLWLDILLSMDNGWPDTNHRWSDVCGTIILEKITAGPLYWLSIIPRGTSKTPHYIQTFMSRAISTASCNFSDLSFAGISAARL